MGKQLSERKKKILQALVDSYINTVEPISSSQIQKRYLPEVSTATIRSELAALEEMGYLTQPHISSGRIPSTMAYRYYVDNILEEDKEIMAAMKNVFNTKFSTVKQIVEDSAKIVSDMTNYTSMLMIASTDKVMVRDVKLVDLFDGKALVLIITDSGVIKNKEIDLPTRSDINYIEVANGLLSRSFAGKTLSEILNNKALAEKELLEFEQIYKEVIDLILEYKNNREDQVYIEGKDKIFNYPEYNDVDKIKSFMTIVEHKEKIQEILNQDDDGADTSEIELSIKIGSEAGKDMEHMALVTAQYSINGKELGKLGVIGPERMDYKKVVTVLKEISKLIKN